MFDCGEGLNMKEEGMTQSLEEGEKKISRQLRLVLNLQHVTQLVMFYAFWIVPETARGRLR